MLGEDDSVQWATRTKAMSDRWASAINQQLGKSTKKEIEELKARIRQLEASKK